MQLSHTLLAAGIATVATVTPAAAAVVLADGDPVLFWHEQFLAATAGPPPPCQP